MKLNRILSGYNTSVMNDNFDEIERTINNDVIHVRDGNNFMDQELDMNSNKILNVGKPTNDYDIARLIDVKNEPGRKGPPGPIGPRGKQGIQGPEGIQGIDGPRGIQGIQGVEGPQGPYGPTPEHEWDGPSLRFQQGDGTWGNYEDLTGPQGPIGITGPQGPYGPTPDHQWNGSSVRFQQGDGKWGNYEDLTGPIGPQGIDGPQGVMGPTPAHEWDGSRIRFLQPDGNWGNWEDVEGPQGPIGVDGPQGVIGLTPAHQWDGTRLRFLQGDGSWGGWEDVQGAVGPTGQTGAQGVQGIQGAIGPKGEQGIEGPIGPRGLTGPQGVQGQSFTVDHIGRLTDKSNYDDRPEGFSYLAFDMPSSGAVAPDDTIDSSIADGVKTEFPIRFPDELEASFLVSIGGSVQRPGTYSVRNHNIVFPTPPFNGARVDIRLVSSVTGRGAIFFKLSDKSGDWSGALPFGKGPQGDRGIKGDIGPRGPQGVQGDKGIQGDQGIQGIDGVQGPAGPQGDRGPIGQKGIQGDEGIQGPQGPKGDQGDRGPIGQKGVQGDRGLVGPQGPKGDQGERGPQGQKGVQGDKGIDGSQGPTGVQGMRGPEGKKGVQGDKGIDGQQGPQGVPGVRGPQGNQGERGPKGFQGDEGTIGPVGPAGQQGPRGLTGAKGPVGDKGATGSQGVRGSRTIYVPTTTTAWNPAIVQSEMQRAGYWPPVDYDLGTMYNNARGFATTYRWFNGRWDAQPLELIENKVLKVSHGVPAADLLPNAVSRAFGGKSGGWIIGSGNKSASTSFSVDGEGLSCLLNLTQLFSVQSTQRTSTSSRPRMPNSLDTFTIKAYVGSRVIYNETFHAPVNYKKENVDDRHDEHTWQCDLQMPSLVLDLGSKTTSSKRIKVEVSSLYSMAGPVASQQPPYAGVIFKA